MPEAIRSRAIWISRAVWGTPAGKAPMSTKRLTVREQGRNGRDLISAPPQYDVREVQAR